MHAWRFWATARDYWQPGQSRIAWPLTISMTAVVLASLTIICGLNLWNRRFFGALQAKNTAVALHQALLFPLLVGGYLAICIFAMWARMTMQRTWRAFVNDRLVDKWLKRSRYYQLELIDGDHKNPEHRIKDDVRIATEMPVDFVTGFITAVLSAATFFVVLSSVGGAITLPFAGGIVLPGYILFIRRPALLRDCQWGRCWRSVAGSCAPPRPKTKPKRNTAIRSRAFGKMPQPQSAEICVIPRRAVCPGGFVAPRHYLPTARMRGATSHCGRTEGGGAWPFSAQARR